MASLISVMASRKRNPPVSGNPRSLGTRPRGKVGAKSLNGKYLGT